MVRTTNQKAYNVLAARKMFCENCLFERNFNKFHNLSQFRVQLNFNGTQYCVFKMFFF